MNEMTKITLSLVAIFVAAGFIMGGTYKVTSPIKFIAEQKEKEEALKEMAPDATDPIKAAGTWELHRKTYEYFAASSNGKPVNYIASTSGKGYSSYIGMLVAIDKDLRVTNLKVLNMHETPGLGDQVLESYFLDQFKGKELSKIVLVKTETTENIQAISGATISSRAVTNGVKDAVQMLVDQYGGGVAKAAAKTAGEGGHK